MYLRHSINVIWKTMSIITRLSNRFVPVSYLETLRSITTRMLCSYTEHFLMRNRGKPVFK